MKRVLFVLMKDVAGTTTQSLAPRNLITGTAGVGTTTPTFTKFWRVGLEASAPKRYWHDLALNGEECS